MQALRVFSEAHRLAHPQQAAIALDVQPFSSSQKYSSVTFETGTYLLGAPEFVLKTTYAAVASELKPYLDKGMRVLLLAKSRGQDAPEPLGYAVLTGRIRENAKETFRTSRSRSSRAIMPAPSRKLPGRQALKTRKHS